MKKLLNTNTELKNSFFGSTTSERLSLLLSVSTFNTLLLIVLVVTFVMDIMATLGVIAFFDVCINSGLG